MTQINVALMALLISLLVNGYAFLYSLSLTTASIVYTILYYTLLAVILSRITRISCSILCLCTVSWLLSSLFDEEELHV